MRTRFEQLLEEAAEPSLRRIRADRERVSDRLRPLLGHIAAQLFAPELNVESAKQACGIRDNSIAIVFHQEVSVPPKRYITQRRMETAARLLKSTPLKVWRIGDLIGYSGLGVFSRAFQRWAGVSPRTYRLQSQTEGTTQDPLSDPAVVERALAGELAPVEAEALIRRLGELYPGVEASPPPQSV